MSQDRKQTGFPSIDKPWLKYYSEEAINAPLPECTIYEYLYENNKDYPSDIAINYLGRKISSKELFENIDRTAAAFLKAGVKEKEIVTVALPSIPEALYCVYALNKIGAVANMIHPLAGTEETSLKEKALSRSLSKAVSLSGISSSSSSSSSGEFRPSNQSMAGWYPLSADSL